VNVGGALLLLLLVVLVVAGLYAVAFLVRLSGIRRRIPANSSTGGGNSGMVGPFLSGHGPTEHAMSRYHVRWYAITMVFLAFDMEMVFMYPWALVVAETGLSAVVEMFVFLAILMAGVVYAWREGALRWT
jgi:NADH-quinone oxidoreductase subunit A